MDIIDKIWLRVSLFFLVSTALLGFTIRLLPLQSVISDSYYFGILQSHSHTGFLGWVYMILYFLLLKYFGREELLKIKKTNIILTILAVFILGMTISFPATGYGLFSILFLSLFLIFSYYSLYYLYKNIDIKIKSTISYKFLIAGIIFYLMSSISPWLLGPIIAKGYKKTALYYNDIFFYLHFLYNGFVTFAMVALFFLDLEHKKSTDNIMWSNLKKALYFLFTGTILNYSESLLWNRPGIIVHLLAFISSILLIIGLYFLYKTYMSKYSHKAYPVLLIRLAISMYILKTTLQLLQSFPTFSNISYMLKSQLIIGYIHLVTLGFITSFILAFLIKSKMLSKNKYLDWGIIFFIIGFALTEIILFIQGLLLWGSLSFFTPYYAFSMMIASAFLLIGFIFILISTFSSR